MNSSDFEFHRKAQWDILVRIDKYISDTNSKTSTILTIQILVGGGAISNIGTLKSFLLTVMNQKDCLAWSAELYIILSSIAIAATALIAIMPNLNTVNKPSLFFFGDIAKIEPIQRKVLFENPTTELLEDLYTQVHCVSMVLSRKMQILKFLYKAIIFMQLLPIAGFFAYAAIHQ